MKPGIPGRSGYFAYIVVNSLLAVVLIGAAFTLQRLRTSTVPGQAVQLNTIAFSSFAITIAIGLILWFVSGIFPLVSARQQARLRPGAMYFFSQRTMALDKSLSQVCKRDVSGPFYYILFVTDGSLYVYAQNSMLLEISSDRVKEVVASSTMFRGYEVPCVSVILVDAGVEVSIPFMAATAPWPALFPTSPTHAQEYSTRIEGLLLRSGTAKG